jgi:hypothetical protein
MTHIDLDRRQNIVWFPKLNVNYFAVTKSVCTAMMASLGKIDIIDPSSSRYDYVYDSLTFITKEYAQTNGCKNVSVIRHPYNRIVSLYKHFVLKDPSRAKELLEGLEVTEIKDVDDFVAKVIPHFPAKNPNHHLKSISYFLCDEEGKVIPDLIFKIEEDKDEISTFLASLGCEFKVANISSFNVELSKESIDIIFERYQKDFNLFKFER